MRRLPLFLVPLLSLVPLLAVAIPVFGESAEPAKATADTPPAAVPVDAERARLADNRLGNEVYQRKVRVLIGDVAADRPEVRLAAIAALGALQDPTVAPTLKARLADRLSPVPERVAAARALAAAGDPAMAQALREASGASESAVRLAAFTAQLELRSTLPEDLTRWAQDTDPDVAGSGISVLAIQPDTTHAELLVRALDRHPNPAVRAAAAAGLGRLGEAADTGILTTALSDGSRQVQDAAAAALAELGRKDAVPSLLLALEAGIVGDGVIEAIRRLTGSDFGWPAARTRFEQQEALERGHAWCNRNRL